MWLEQIGEPGDLRDLSYDELAALAGEIRDFIVAAVAENAGHLGSNLGVVELTLALHRVFDSPRDALLWDTGHQAYVHKLVTGRQAEFARLRQTGGLCGYPSRAESPHDFVENSHASTILSYAYGLAVARDLGTADHRHVVAVIGDGSMTGGMSYEALNNLGHSGKRVIIILNDNGRSYAPTISNLTAERSVAPDGPETAPIISRIGDALSQFLTDIRLNPVYVRRQRKLEELVRDVPLVGNPAERAVEAVKAAARELLQPPSFFEALGVRYVGPIDGHDLAAVEPALRNAVELSAEGPIVVHVLTQKGRGYPPAEDDDEKHLHDAPVFDPAIGPPKAVPTGYTQTFAETVIKLAEADDRIVAITAAMAGPTGLLPFEERFPDRFFDVGIAEQHAVTAAAGMAMGGMRPIVAIYSTFLNRAWDQVVYDVALHRLPVRVLHRSGWDHRAGRTEPPRRLRPGDARQGSGDARARPVERPGAAGDDGRRRRCSPTTARSPSATREAAPARWVSTRSAPASTPGRSATPATRRDRSASSPSASSSPPPSAPQTISPRPGSTSRCGTPGAAPRSTRRCWPTPRSIAAVVTVEDGVVDGGIGSTISMRVGELAPTVRHPIARHPDAFHPPRRQRPKRSCPPSVSTTSESPPPSAAPWPRAGNPSRRSAVQLGLGGRGCWLMSAWRRWRVVMAIGSSSQMVMSAAVRLRRRGSRLRPVSSS